MTSTVLVEIFEVLLDKFGSPYLTEEEIFHLANMSQYERFNRVLPDDMGGQVNFEFDENTLHNIKPFIYTLSGLTPTSGLLTNATINSALVSASHSGAEMFRLMNVSKDEVPIKWAKHNMINAYKQNAFKAPSATNAFYTVQSTGIQFHPSSLTDIDLTVIKKPRTISDTVDPEWDDYNMNSILLIMCQYAGISIRDEEIIGAINNVNVAK